MFGNFHLIPQIHEQRYEFKPYPGFLLVGKFIGKQVYSSAIAFLVLYLF